MIRDEQEIRDYLEALETMYREIGFSKNNTNDPALEKIHKRICLQDREIKTLRWVLMRDKHSEEITKVIADWRKNEDKIFGSELQEYDEFQKDYNKLLNAQVEKEVENSSKRRKQ